MHNPNNPTLPFPYFLIPQSSRNSMLHSMPIHTHAFLNAGMINDTFLCDNLDFLKKASNAGLGCIHHGHVGEAMELLDPYLPAEGATIAPKSGYSEGGALMALGLNHAEPNYPYEKRQSTTGYLKQQLRNYSSNETIVHGAATGIDLASLGCRDPAIFNELKDVLYTDTAVAGEVAGLAMGMVMRGVARNGDESVTEMLAYAKDTTHEKILLAAGRATVASALSELTLATDVIPTVSGQPVGPIDAPFAIENYSSDVSSTIERGVGTSVPSKLNITVGRDATSVTRCSDESEPKPTLTRHTPPETIKSFRARYLYDCDDGWISEDYDVAGLGDDARREHVRQKSIAAEGNMRCMRLDGIDSISASLSTTMSFLLCSVGMFASLILRASGCVSNVGSIIGKTRKPLVMTGRVGRLGKCLFGLSILASLVAAKEESSQR
jgi:hypothetical protein